MTDSSRLGPALAALSAITATMPVLAPGGEAGDGSISGSDGARTRGTLL
jgi:hypothetical protein